MDIYAQAYYADLKQNIKKNQKINKISKERERERNRKIFHLFLQ